MEIKTKYLGTIQIDQEKVIDFPNGLPGFLEETTFVLLDFPDNPVFQILQSVNTQNIAFIITNPYMIYKDYTFKLDDAIMNTLQIKNEKDVAVFTIVTLKNPFDTSTLNLKAPIIINPNKMIGKQYILNVDEYSTKAPILPTPVMEKGVK